MKRKCLGGGCSLCPLIALAAAFVLFGWGQASRADPQDSKAKATAAGDRSATAVTRGKYLVEGVAMCGDCHTPPGLSGVPGRSKWLMGAPVTPKPSSPAPDWPTTAPRLAGTPPGTDAQMITLLTASASDAAISHDARAEAVLAYLKSVTPAEPATSPPFKRTDPR